MAVNTLELTMIASSTFFSVGKGDGARLFLGHFFVFFWGCFWVRVCFWVWGLGFRG